MLQSSSRLVLGALLLLCACVAPLRRPFTPDVRRPLVMDVRHYEIELQLDHRARHVSGEVAITLAALPDRGLASVELDAVELDITRVWDADDRELTFQLTPETVVIALAEPLAPGEQTELHLAWSAFPRRGLYFEGPSRADPTRPWHVWSQGQSHETRFWLPCWDQPTDRASHAISLTVDGSLRTLCAGDLLDSYELPASGQRTDVWSMPVPHASYLMTLVAGELAEALLPGGPVPLPVVARERDLPAALFATRHTADMLAFFGELTGRAYPFSKYAQVFIDDFTSGGMENISATTMYDEGLHAPSDEPQVDISGLVAHELAHQWFGDLVTCDGWAELWLNEGFADWCELRWQGHHLGRAEMERRALDAQDAGCQAELDFSRPVVWHAYTDPDDLFDSHSYEGAAARIRLLAHVLGDDVFLAALAEHVERNASRLVDTDAFQVLFEEVSGRDLQRFFDEWFRGRGYPVLDARLAGDGTRISIRQTQAERGWPAVFALRFHVSWSRGGSEQRAEVVFDRDATVELALGGQGALDWVRLDAGAVVPGERHLHQDEAAWARQLVDADDPVTRLVAARWFAGDRWVRPDHLAATPGEPGREALLRAAGSETWWAVREELARALEALDTPAAGMALIDLSQDEDPRVRAAAIAALGGRLEGDSLAVVRAATDDENGAVAAAAVAALVQSGRADGFPTLRRLLAEASTEPFRTRLARDLVTLLADVDEPEALTLLVDTAANHPERWVRAAAVAALGRAPGPSEPIFQALCVALHDEADGVRRAAAEAMGRDGLDGREQLQLRARWNQEVSPEVLEALEELLR